MNASTDVNRHGSLYNILSTYLLMLVKANGSKSETEHLLRDHYLDSYVRDHYLEQLVTKSKCAFE